MNEQNLTLIRRLGQVIEELTRIHDELASLEPEPEVEPAAMPEKFDKDHPYDPALFGWVDLGLPSGRLWADRPAPGYYQYDQAVEAFGEDLPKGVAMAELCEECEWTWDKKRKGYDVVGKNGNRIFIPALGWQDWDEATGELIPGALSYVGSHGSWWAFSPSSQASARSLSFYASAVSPLSTVYRSSGCAVLPSRESYPDTSTAARI